MSRRDVVLADRIPSVEEFRAVATAVGWADHFHWASAEVALEGSLFAVTASRGDDVVGVARIVGDGTRYFSVQDVMVHPSAADEGVATAMVERLLERIGATAPAAAVVSLFASPDAVDIYRSLGFTDATSDPLGMQLQVEPVRAG